MKSKEVGVPSIKGSLGNKKLSPSYSYLTSQDRQQLYRILMKRGMDKEAAKDRIMALEEGQREVRKKIRKGDESEEEIKHLHTSMLEDLYNL